MDTSGDGDGRQSGVDGPDSVAMTVAEQCPPAMTIGICVHAEPQRLKATLVSLRALAPEAVVLLLPDGPDEATRAALAGPGLNELPQLGTDEPRGTPACWNRLVAATEAEVVVLLESGAVLAPGALEILVAALREPGTGWRGRRPTWRGTSRRRFAGPATARRRSPRRRARPGRGSATRCGRSRHRAPFTARRRAEEAKRFEASRRRYQDKFCARRLRGEPGGYEPHCKGEDCAEFAPAALIRIREPLAAATTTASISAPVAAVATDIAHASAAAAISIITTDVAATVTAAAIPPLVASPPSPPAITAGDRPLVSCIMPTRDRRGWVPQAIGYFLRQDFADAELVIVDDGEPAVRDLVPDHPRIRYLRVDGRRTIGAKRNLACAEARGELIAHWDDDDWYPASRLRRQVEALRAAGAAMCGTSQLYFYQPSAGQAWRYAYAARGTPVLVGTSLLYRRQLWERSRFADIQVGEDVRFVRAAAAAVHDLADPALCVATIHAGNTSPRNPDALYWRPHSPDDIHRLLGDDLTFYQRIAAPLISCIMPTADRRAFVPLGVRGFVAQDWPNRELIVVDDGRDAVGDLVAGVPGGRYLRLARRASIGAKRNLACAEARGELIAHWDDDDWYAPGRLSWQATAIVAGKADITGLENRFILQLPGGAFWTTRPELRQRMFAGDVIGGTMMFRRSLFTGGLRYPEVSMAEDAAFLREAMRRGHRLAQLDNPGLFVYVRHGRNTWQFEPGRFLDPRGWEVVAGPTSLPGETLDAYRAAAATPLTSRGT
jgi:glycosyltransferase involved in cell wall biosynthesis